MLVHSGDTGNSRRNKSAFVSNALLPSCFSRFLPSISVSSIILARCWLFPFLFYYYFFYYFVAYYSHSRNLFWSGIKTLEVTWYGFGHQLYVDHAAEALGFWLVRLSGFWWLSWSNNRLDMAVEFWLVSSLDVCSSKLINLTTLLSFPSSGKTCKIRISTMRFSTPLVAPVI